MRHYLIVIFAILLSSTNSLATEDADRAALGDAFREYTALFDNGDYEASLVEAKRVLDLAERLFPETDKQLAAATVNYGDNLLYLGRRDEAAAVLELALARFEGVYGANGPELIGLLLSMAAAGASPPEFKPLEQFLDRAYEIAGSNFDHSSTEYADSLLGIVSASYFNPPSESTGDNIRKALVIYRSQEDPSAYRVGNALAALGVYHARRGEYRDAERRFREALDILDPTVDELQSLRDEVSVLLESMLEELESRAEEFASLKPYHGYYRSDPDFDKTLPIVRVAPVYPEAALRERSTGHVDFLFTVDEQGFVINPVVVDFTGHESLQYAALGAVKKFRYLPQYIDGQAVAVQGVRTRISFEIEN